MLVSCIVEVVHCDPYMIHCPAQIRNIISRAEEKVTYLSCEPAPDLWRCR